MYKTGLNKKKAEHIKTSLLMGIFIISLFVRFLFFFLSSDNLRHGSANIYGSTAIGLYKNKGLTFNENEIDSIAGIENNYEGKYIDFYSGNDREIFTTFLPGPAVLLSLLWKLIPIFNFFPYILFQIIIDSLSVVLFFEVLSKEETKIAALVTIFLMVSPPNIEKVLMMGYDYWPQLSLMVSMLIGLLLIRRPGLYWPLLVLGVFSGLILWFRNLTSFLPLTISPFLIYLYIRNPNINNRQIPVRILLYLTPVMISLFMLSFYRYSITGNPRPTRSTFWHTFYAGIGQFKNDYGIENNDKSVWEYAKSLDPDLVLFDLNEMYKLPNSPYELVLKDDAKRLIREHPGLIIRNTIYRGCILVSPLLDVKAKYLPKMINRYILLLGGILLFVIWVLGIFEIYPNKNLFYLLVAIYLYFIIFFSWFYINGRVILPILFLNIMIYLFGLRKIAHFVEDRMRSIGKSVSN